MDTRFRAPIVVGLLIAVVAGCSSSSDSAEVSVVTTAVPQSSTVAPTKPEDATTPTSTSPEPAGGIDLSELPGRVVLQSVGCGVPFDMSSMGQAMAGIDSVDEAMAIIDQFDPAGLSSVFQVCVMNPDGSGLTLVSEAEVDTTTMGWTLDGETVMYRSNGQWFVVDPDGSNRRAWDDPTYLPWRVSPDESVYVNRSVHDENVYLTPVGQERRGPGRRAVLESIEVFETAYRWSPDGRFLLYFETPGDCPTMWKVDVTSLERTQISGPGSTTGSEGLCAMQNTASWSPDGSTILVLDYEGLGVDPRPYVIDVDGTNLRPLVTEDFYDDPEWMVTDVAWSPDGQYVMVDVVSVPGLEQGAPTLHVVRLADGAIEPIPVDGVLTVIDLMWMPEAPALDPLPHEDMDAV